MKNLNHRGWHIQRHWPLGVVLLLFAALAISYNLVLPLGEVSDAGAHFALIRFMAEEKRPPVTVEERSMIGIKGDASPLYHGLVALLTQHVEVSDLPELPNIHDDGRRAIPADQRINQGIFHTEDESFPYKGIALAWHLAGLLSIPMGMVTIIAVYFTALAIYPTRTYFALAAAAFVAFLPRFIVSSAVINDDNLAFPLIAFSWYIMVRLLQGKITGQTFIILGTLIGLATITKYHSLLLLAEMSLIIGFVAWRDQWGLQTAFRRWSWVMFFFVLTAGWWLGFVLIAFNDIKDSGLIAGLLAPLGDPVVTEGSTYLFSTTFNTISIWKFDYWLSWTFRSFWMHYNGLYTGMQMQGRELTYWMLYIGFGSLMVISLVGLLLRGMQLFTVKRKLSNLRRWRSDLLFMALHFFMYLGLMMLRYMLFPAWSTSQGRHLYPALAPIAIFFVLGLDELKRLSPRFRGNDRALATVVGTTMFSISVIIIPVFLLPVYYPLLPIVTQHPDDAPIENRLTHKFVADIRFEGYDMPVNSIEAGQTLPITLYWRTRTRQKRDYLVELCLRDDTGTAVSCYQGHPADGRYPMRAWEKGYLLRDTIHLPTPTCLASDRYQLTLAVLPLRSDIAATTIDESGSSLETINLTNVNVRATPLASTLTLWTKGEELKPNSTIWQIRQTLTLLSYQSDLATPHFISDTSAQRWEPLTRPTVYRCPNGVKVTTLNFIVHPGLEPGDYTLAGARLPVRVHTRRRNFSVPVMEIETPTEINFGNELTLLGYNVDLSPRRPGTTVDITTFWRARKTMGRQYVGSFHLLDRNLTMWGQDDHPLGEDFPSALWAPGEVVTSVHKVPIHNFVAAGQYNLRLSVYAVESDTLDFLTAQPENSKSVQDLFLGQIRVLDMAKDTGPDNILQVNLADQIQLQGYDLDTTKLSKEGQLGLTLYWQALKPPQADYTVFTQLLGPDAIVWAQQDNQPQGGSFPTSEWPVNNTIVDHFKLQLAENAPQGHYQLLIGMYDLTNNQRLPAVDAQGRRLYNDAIVIEPIILE